MTVGYIVGAGAQGRIVSEVWRAQEPAVALRFLDDNDQLHGRSVQGVPVAGPVSLLGAPTGDQIAAVLAIGHNAQRLALAETWSRHVHRWALVVHPSAVMMPSVTIGGGTVVFAHAVINTSARIGEHVIVNTGAIIEHDAVVEDGASVGPGVSMGGRVVIARGAFLSAGVTVAPRIRIGAGAVIGAGATVVTDIPPGVLAYGVPARVVRRIDEDFDFRRLL